MPAKMWTNPEDKFLEQWYPKKGSKYCAEMLNRSRTSVTTRASYLGIKRDKSCLSHSDGWSEAEIAFLVENYVAKGLNYCVNNLNKSQSAIQHKAERLGLKRKGYGRRPRIIEKQGYLYVSTYMFEIELHRLIAEFKESRIITDDEIVHHVNEDKYDNRPDNLEVITRAEHMKMHKKTRDEKGRFMKVDDIV